MKLTWITQSGYIIDHGGKRLVIDPYLSTTVEDMQGLTRLTPIPVSVSDLKPNYIYCTHNHLDHFDPHTMLEVKELYPSCKIIGPSSVIAHALKLGFDKAQLINLNAGQSIDLDDFRFNATPAFHSDPLSTGLLLLVADQLLYLSGDTEETSRLLPLIQQMSGGRQIDLMFVCINGKLGNMNTQEAIAFSKALQPKQVIPNHYGLFAENTIDPQYFIDGCRLAGLNYQLLQPGITIDLQPSLQE
ncbi:MAG: MBL fold metallo-hydrolase [Mucilaginibacter sp.]|uniref:MBL fold metallo-hydrolase n=1 Tax=Mucilaginibacter sp. TaxID=1882438 RepID=UPI003266D5E3